MKKTKIIDPKPIRRQMKIKVIKGVFDSDLDGVPNDKDCVWYDRKRQDDRFDTAIGRVPRDVDWLRNRLNMTKIGGTWSPLFGTFQRTGQKELTLTGRSPFGTEEDINWVKNTTRAIGWRFVDGTR